MDNAIFFFFSSRRRHTRYWRDWSSDVCSSDLLSAEVYGDFLLKRSQLLYSCLDSLEQDVREKDLETVLWETELPLVPVLAKMEKIGIKIDKKYFEQYSLELTEKLNSLEEEIWKEAGEKFNLNSPKQLGEVLFLKLNLPTGKKTKTGFSTDVEVLENLSSQGFQIASNLLEYRKLAKLKNTYVDPLPKMKIGRASCRERV